jgi:hypothetical protein
MNSQDQLRNSAYLSVYSLLDEVCYAGHVPAGSTGTIHQVIDLLRRVEAPVEDIRAAENMSVAIHRLSSALRVGDREEQARIRHELQGLGARWLQTPMRLALN